MARRRRAVHVLADVVRSHGRLSHRRVPTCPSWPSPGSPCSARSSPGGTEALQHGRTSSGLRPMSPTGTSAMERFDFELSKQPMAEARPLRVCEDRRPDCQGGGLGRMTRYPTGAEAPNHPAHLSLAARGSVCGGDAGRTSTRSKGVGHLVGPSAASLGNVATPGGLYVGRRLLCG
jgi:hypothetical protein